MIGALLKAHADDCAVDGSCGVDYSHPAIEKCRRLHPGVRFLEGDFTDAAFMSSLGQYEIVLLVNALHEVFSAGYEPGARRSGCRPGQSGRGSRL